MRLEGGPANGRELPVPAYRWVWVAVEGNELHVFDLGRPDVDQSLNRVGRGGWDEYLQDPHDPTVYRWSRKNP